MNGEKDFHCFDKLRTPFIVTDKSGIVIYRNNLPSAQIKKPHRGGNIFKYISDYGNDIESFINNLPGYAVIEYLMGTGINATHYAWRAFVFETNADNCCDSFLFWIFPRRILLLNGEQSRMLLPFYCERLGTLRALLKRYCESHTKSKRNLPFSRSPESAYDSISLIAEGQPNSEINDAPVDLAFFLKTFGESASRQLGLRGFRFETYHDNLRIGDTLTNAGSELAALCAQLVYVSLLISGNHSLIWNYSYSEKSLNLEFISPYSDEKTCTSISGSLYDAAYNNPDITLELFFCDLLWNAPGRRVVWISTPEQSVFRVDITLTGSKFIMLRQDNRLAKLQIEEKINELMAAFGNNLNSI